MCATFAEDDAKLAIEEKAVRDAIKSAPLSPACLSPVSRLSPTCLLTVSSCLLPVSACLPPVSDCLLTVSRLSPARLRLSPACVRSDAKLAIEEKAVRDAIKSAPLSPACLSPVSRLSLPVS